jgi:ribonucleoside-diphosphate reductase alpha chain
MKYSRYLPEKKRRETWDEIVSRNMNMHIENFPELEDEIRETYKLVYDRKVLPSMRSMQFAGKPIQVNNSRIFNCSYVPINHSDAFSEVMWLLLGGTGVGFSVQKHHIAQLPKVRKPFRNRGRKKRYLVGDSIEGWADAVKVLVESYFYGKQEIDFDFRDIRPKGARLVTAGGKAPGPEPLRIALVEIQSIFENALSETQDRMDFTYLKPIEAHDIICHIADAVLAGGIRRAALISGFSPDDNEMIQAKSGNWWESNPQRGRANNSAVFYRPQTTREEFDAFWQRVVLSGSGEPGIYWTNDETLDSFTNPCAEIGLSPNSFCNLTEINASDIRSQDELNERARAAAFIGTLQATYTNFHYLRDIWRETAERESLLGVSMTGIASGATYNLNLKEASTVVLQENERVSKILGINPAHRATCVKPSGTTSLVLGTSSGIHAWHNDYYIRRIRVGKNESIYNYLMMVHPELVEDEKFRPESQAVISIPQKSPKGATTRSESVFDLLERARKWNNEWVRPGHREGVNTHNVSVTISVKDNEWNAVGDWMWEKRNDYNGISVLPYDGGTYVQAPFEDIRKKEYDRLFSSITHFDISEIYEEDDNTNLTGELACTSGACEII